MDTNKIKRFATEARKILKAGIAAKIASLGFDKLGDVVEENKPQLMQGGSLWKEQLLTEGFYHQWMSLYSRIQRIGIKDVYEEADYTWFNRLCAIRILQKNHLCPPVLAYADAARTPVIVDEARQGHLPQMREEDRLHLVELLDDDTKVTEQFAILVTAWCHDNPIMQQCFGGIADYTELLLPANILAEGGFVDLLNHTEFITDDDFQSPELTGWLYQFYISERKDEVFAKKGKFEADEIPAATQIFTPNWIVKYMVQNTVGRIYLDNNPYETQLQKKWKYLIYNSEFKIYNSEAASTTAQPMINSKSSSINYSELTDLKVADLACGSGHILNECFDLLYDLYIAEGYGRGEAIENIFRHNLTGIDLDTRAKQLAMFSLLLKACQKDSAFADGHCLPNVLDMAGVVPQMNEEQLQDACLQFMGGYENVAGEMLAQDFELLRNAETLGSIMEFNADKDYLAMLRYHYEDWTEGGTEDCPTNIKALLPGVRIILALTEKYHALVMNPPYMGGGKMNAVLSKYVKEHYEEGKADLFSVFMQIGMERLTQNGKMAQINMQSWMFLSSFEKLRTRFLNDYNIDSMLHLGPRTFDELSGEVVQNTAFVLSKHLPTEQGGVYYRLVDGKNCADKEQLFLSHIHGNEDDNLIYYPNVKQKNFEKIPGAPIGYWLSNKIIDTFENQNVSTVSNSRCGMNTGDNDSMIRLWFEVSYLKIGTMCNSIKDFHSHAYLYVPYNKGGSARKWYGNLDFVLKFDKTNYNILLNQGNHLPSRQFYFKDCITWSDVTSKKLGVSFRYEPIGTVFDGSAAVVFIEGNLTSYLLGLLNTKYIKILSVFFNPSMHFKLGDYNKIPYIENNNKKENINIFVKDNISISKSDWDAHETSWDFQRNELLSIDTDTYMDNIHHEIERHEKETGEHLCIDPAAPELDSLEWRMEQYKKKWEHKFMQLHANEEELNRQFISIYGLEDELTPDVPLDEITILQQGEISIDK